MTQPPERTSSRDLVEYTSSEALASSFFASSGLKLAKPPAWPRAAIRPTWPGPSGSVPDSPVLPDLLVARWRMRLLHRRLFQSPCVPSARFLRLPAASRPARRSPRSPLSSGAHPGALSLGFHTTADGLPPELLRVFSCRMKPFALSRFFPRAYATPDSLPRAPAGQGPGFHPGMSPRSWPPIRSKRNLFPFPRPALLPREDGQIPPAPAKA